jgi:predicted DNA-binding transcriptional regulator AlpA
MSRSVNGGLPQDVLDEELMTAEEVAMKFKVPKTWAYQVAKQGAKSRTSEQKMFLTYVQLGAYVRFRESDVRSFIEAQTCNDADKQTQKKVRSRRGRK